MLRYAPRQRFVLAFGQLFFFIYKKKCRESAISRSEASPLAKNFTISFYIKKKTRVRLSITRQDGPLARGYFSASCLFDAFVAACDGSPRRMSLISPF